MFRTLFSKILGFTHTHYDRLNIHLEPAGSLQVHGILVDGMIERIDGSPEFADAELGRRREQGHDAAYLFAAASDQEFERKRKVRPLLPRVSALRPMKGTI